MTFKVTCDGCGKIQESEINSIGEPYNPINSETNAQWWSRTKDGKTIHACRKECMDDGLVWPV